MSGPDTVPAGRRLFDFCGLLLLAPLTLTLTALVALAVLLDSPGPVLFRSRRVGFRGQRFEMVKFRTMRVDAAGASLAGADDRRVTPVGRFLRAARLDELPQLWNVLRGDMSLVGPRPELEEFVALHAAEYEEILSVPPGITGPTQLRYAGLEPRLLSGHEEPERYYREHLLPDKVELDRDYARNRSTALDLRVLARTLALPLLLRRQRRAAAVSRRLWPRVLVGSMVAAALPLLFLLTLGAPR